MKKTCKLLAVMLLALMVLTLASCLPHEEDLSIEKHFKNVDMKEIYTIYLDYMEEMGEEPLSYEEWFDEVHGDEFTKEFVPKIRRNENSEYWEISYNNGKGWNSLRFKTETEEQKKCNHTFGKWITISEGNEHFDGIRYRECEDCNFKDYNFKIDHSYEITVVNPTCENDGYTLYVCKDCGHEYKDTFTTLDHDWVETGRTEICSGILVEYECSYCGAVQSEAVEGEASHMYGDWYTVTESTCITKGTERHDCERCDDFESREVSFADHKLGAEYVVTSANCVTEGENRADCTIPGCTYYKTTKSEKTGHSLEHFEALDATCTTAGHYAYDACTVCDYTTFRSTPALGHKYGNWYTVTESTCITKGTERHDCERCDHYETRALPIGDHKLQHHNALAATCTTKGYEAYDECDLCDYTTFKSTPALGHKYGSWYTVTESTCITQGTERHDCERCNHYETRSLPLGDHKLQHHEALAATCTAEGYNAYDECDLCDYTTFKRTPALGHKYGDWYTVTESNCITNGTERHDCERCNHYETRALPIGDHKLQHHNALAATCTTKGYEAYDECDLCDYTTFESTPALGHDYGEWEIVSDSTCTELGSKRRGCVRCDHFEFRDIGRKSHSVEEWTLISEATCSIGSISEGECTECHTLLKQYGGALGHNYEKIDYRKPTCNQDGYTLYVCQREGCGAEKRHAIPFTGHQYGPDGSCMVCGNNVEFCNHELVVTKVEPTCTTIGYTEYRCSLCSYVKRDQITSNSVHKWSVGEVISEKTCTDSGLVRYTCSDCGAVRNDTVPASHNYQLVESVPADCTNDGMNYYECKDCSDVDEILINAHHVTGQTVVVQIASCEREGISESACTICGVTYQIIYGKLGHEFIDGSCSMCGVSYMDILLSDSNDQMHGMHFEIDGVVSNYGPDTVNQFGVFLDYNEGATITKVAILLVQEGSVWKRTIACVGTDITYAYYVPYLATGDKIIYSGLNCEWIYTFPLSERENGVWCYSDYVTITVNFEDYKGELIQYINGIEQSGAETRVFDNLSDMASWISNCDSHIESDWIVDIAPDCLNGGHRYKICKACKATVASEDLLALNHDLYDVAGKEYSCTEDGWDAYQQCSRCDYNDKVVITAPGHSIVTEEKKDPTCTEPGHNAYEKCTRTETNCTYTTYLEIPKLGHDMGPYVEITAATCQAPGLERCSCRRDGCEHTEEREIPIKDHTPGEWTTVSEAKCTEDGLKYQMCVECGLVMNNEITTATGHTFGEWRTISYPTCVTKGEQERSCHCGVTESYFITEKQHNFINNDDPETKDVIEEKCETCSKTRAIPKNVPPSNLQSVIRSDPDSFELIVLGNSEQEIRDSLTLVNTMLEQYYGVGSDSAVMGYDVVFIGLGRAKIMPHTAYKHGITYRFNVKNNVQFEKYYCDELIVIMNQSEPSGEDVSGNYAEKYDDINNIDIFTGKYVISESSEDSFSIKIPMGYAGIINEFGINSKWDISSLGSTFGKYAKVAEITPIASGGFLVKFTKATIFDIYKSFSDMGSYAVEVDGLESQWGGIINDINTSLIGNLKSNPEFIALISILESSADDYLKELGLVMGEMVEDNLKIKVSIKKISKDTFEIKLDVNLEIPVKNKDKEKLGSIDVNLVIVNTSKIEIDPHVEMFDKSFATVYLDLTQTGSDDIEFTVKFNFEYELSEGEKKDFALNTQTNTFHRSACMYVTKMSNKNNIEYYTEDAMKSNLEGKHLCKVCQPANADMLTKQYVVNHDTMVIHRATCIYVGSTSNFSSVTSYEDLLNADYHFCDRCKLSSLSDNSFEMRMLRDLKYADWNEIISDINSWKEDSGSSKLVNSLIDSLKKKTQDNDKGIFLGGLYFTIYEVVDVDLSVYFVLNLNIQATFQYNCERNAYVNNMRVEVYTHLLRAPTYRIYTDYGVPEYTKEDYLLVGKIGMQAGIKLVGGIDVAEVGLELAVEFGVYADASGVFSESTITDKDGNVAVIDQILAARFEAGVYIEYTISIRFGFFKLKVYGHTDRHPFYQKGFDKLYYSYPSITDYWTIDNEKSLRDQSIKVEYFDLKDLDAKGINKKIENLALVPSYNSRYYVEFSFANGEYIYEWGGKIYIREDAPHEFTDILYITFVGYDEFSDEYEKGSACFRLPVYTIYISGHNHQFDNGVVKTQSTCVKQGNKVYTCQECGFTKSESLPLIDHNWVYTHIEVTCTKDGFDGDECSMCQKRDGVVTEAVGHIFESNFTIDRDATCTAEGSKSKHCVNCDAKTDVTKIDKIRHSYGEEFEVERTCTTGGYKYKVCSMCDGKYIYDETDPLGHTSYSIKVVQNTCEIDGYTLYKCSTCQVEYKDDFVSKTGHNEYKSTVVAPTCTERGYTVYLCKNDDCSHTVNRDYINALDHDYGSWYTVTVATCTSYGYERRDCGREGCEHYQGRSISPISHYYIATVIKPTCTKMGYTEYRCACGSNYKSDYTDIIPHEYVNGVCSCGDTNLDVTPDEYFKFVLLSDGSYSVAAADTSKMPNYVGIPDTYNGKAVTVIAANAFYNCKNILAISIPDSIKRIESQAFYYCSSLGTISIGEDSQLSYIGSYAFSNTKISGLNLPGTLSETGNDAFSGCSYLTSVYYFGDIEGWCNIKFGTSNSSYNVPTYNGAKLYIDGELIKDLVIPEGVTAINGYAFYKWDNLESVSISADVVTIGYGAFAECVNLKNVSFAEDSRLERIYSSAFNNNKLLSSIVLPASLSYTGTSVFAGCNALESISYLGDVVSWCNNTFEDQLVPLDTTKLYINGELVEHLVLPDEVEVISSNAFRGYGYLKTLICGENSRLSVIGGYAFNGCTSINNVVLPKSISRIETNAFKLCHKIMTVHYLGEIRDWFDINFASYESNPMNCGAYLYLGYSVVGGDYVTEITIPESVTDLSNKFAGCHGLKTVKLAHPDQRTNFGSYAFYECRDLESVEIPSLITSIGEGTFYGCNRISQIVLPKTVTSIGKNAFSLGENASVIYNGTVHDWIKISFANSNANPLLNGASLFIDDKLVTDVIIPANITSLNYTFAGCKQLESVIFEKGSAITSIGAYAFFNCGNLTTFVLPESVVSIGDYAFYRCDSLEKITISSRVTGIGKQAFYYCDSITIYTSYESKYYQWNSEWIDDNSRVVWGHLCNASNSVSSVVKAPTCSERGYTDYVCVCGREYRDSYVDVLTHVYDNGVCSLCGIKIPTPDEYFVFTKLSDGTYSVKLASGISNLPSVIVIPNTYAGSTVTRIENYAFDSRSGITKVVIPNTVTYIGNYAFRGCTSLTEVEFTDGGSVTTIGEYTFYNCNKLTAITIPDSVKTISSYAFQSCGSLTNVYISENSKLEAIEYDAFSSTAVKSIDLPAGVKRVRRLFGYSGGKSINYLGDVEGWCSINFVEDPFGSYSGTVYICGQLVESVVIPDGTEQIGQYTFNCWTALKSVTIPDSVKTIGSNAFSRCTGITEIKYLGNLEGWCRIQFSDATSNPAYASSKETLYIGGSAITDIVIPNSIQVLSYTFAGCNQITSVTFNNNGNLDTIGSYAFYGCNKIKEIIIPHGVKTIGGSAFYNCSSTTSVTIPNTVKTVGSSAFGNCSSLKDVYYGGTIDEWISVAFANGTANPMYYAANIHIQGDLVDRFYIPEEMTQIPDYAFYGMDGIREIVVHKNVTSIGAYAFANCSNLESVIFEDGINISTIDNYTFKGSKSLKSIFIPATVKTIGSYAFQDCSSLESVIFGEGSALQYIYDGAFYNCSSLRSFTIPSAVISLNGSIFYNCTAIEMVDYLGDLSSYLKISFGSDTANPTYYGAPLYIKGRLVKDVVIPEGITDIKQYAFIGNTHIESIKIASTVTSIGNYAFYKCSALDSIEIPSSVTKIGSYVFYGCTSLSEVSIPSSVTTIGTYLFYGCTSLSEVSIPSSVTTIGNSAFYGCTSLSEIAIPSSVTTIGNSAFYGCTSLSEIAIPSSVTSIGNYVFQGCTSLSKISIPSSVTSIGSSAFYGCIVLREISIPSSVTTIGNSAFYGCTLLETVTIGDDSKLATIGQSAFANCTSIEQLTIPASVTNIQYNAFYGCTSIKRVDYAGDMSSYLRISLGSESSLPMYYGAVLYIGGEKVKNLVIPDGITTISAYAFTANSHIESVVIPASVTSIGNSAFYNCNYLKEVIYLGTLEQWCAITFANNSSNPLYYGAAFSVNGEQITNLLEIPYGVTTINSYAFYGMSYVKALIIHGGVNEIKSYAFGGMTNLTSVIIGGEVNKINNYTFYNSICNINCAVESKPSAWTSSWNYGGSGTLSAYYGILEYGITDDGFVWVKTSDGKIAVTGYISDSILANVPQTINGQSVASITKYALYKAIHVRYVIIPGTIEMVEDYVIPYNVYTAVYSDFTSQPTGWNYYWFGGYNYSITWGIIDHGVTEDGFLWIKKSYSNNVVSWVVAGYIGNDDHISIPATIDGNAVDRIGKYAFVGTTDIKSVYIPASIPNMDVYAFYNCQGMMVCCEATSRPSKWNSSWCDNSSIIVWGSKEIEENDNDFICAETANGTLIIIAYNGDATELVIPENINGKTVTAIAPYSFRGSAVTSVIIPNTVTSIGAYAFADCKMLETVSLTTGINAIGEYAFANCSALNAISIPDETVSIGQRAFENCTSLSEITIPESVTSVGVYMFNGCTSLERAYVFASVQALPNNSFYNCHMLSDVKLSESIKTIGSTAFYMCKSLVNIYLPTSLVTISDSAFNGCTSLKSVDIPDSVQNIGSSAFNGCTSLKSVDIPDSVQNIGSSAFNGCTSLESISLPEALTIISSYVFQGCTSLESVDIPASVQSIGSSAFNGCTSLESISLPEALTIISSSLFQGCTSLGSIVVPDKVTTIESNAFYGCTAMESVVIGSNVKKINSQSFYNCSNLKIVYIHSKFIAYTDVSSTSAIGYLLQYAAVVNILAEIDDVNDAYINLHPHIEIINQNGVEYVSYSKHMHIWQQNRILVETVECENDGLARYYCVDCDIMNDVVLRCHDIINHEGREPGCLEDGYKAYETCSRCDYTTFEVIPAHGHMIESEVNIIVDPFDTKNDIFYPFTYEDGKFTSNNHDHSSSSSFVVVATHACDINVYATISSESGCDRLTIYRNGTSIATISGTQTFTQTISLQVGDKLTFTYSKDGSVNGGTDSTTITMTYDKISVVEKSYVSVNDADISCDKDVVCDICDTLVREAAEHDMGDWHTGDSEGTEIRECNNCSYKESH